MEKERRNIRHLAQPYWNSAYKVESLFNIDKPNILTLRTSVKLTTELSGEALEIIKTVEKEYKREIKRALNLKKGIIIFDYPNEMKKNSLTLNIEVTAYIDKEITTKVRWDANQTMVGILTSMLQTLSDNRITPIKHHLKK